MPFPDPRFDTARVDLVLFDLCRLVRRRSAFLPYVSPAAACAARSAPNTKTSTLLPAAVAITVCNHSYTISQLGRVDNSRPFYVRVRMPDPTAGANPPAPGRHSPPCYHWSDFFVISKADHARRNVFNSRQPEVRRWLWVVG